MPCSITVQHWRTSPVLLSHSVYTYRPTNVTFSRALKGFLPGHGHFQTWLPFNNSFLYISKNIKCKVLKKLKKTNTNKNFSWHSYSIFLPLNKVQHMLKFTQVHMNEILYLTFFKFQSTPGNRSNLLTSTVLKMEQSNSRTCKVSNFHNFCLTTMQ